MLKEKIGIIGAGKIGSAIARGVIGAGLVAKDRVMASDVSEALRNLISRELGIVATPNNGAVCDSPTR
jgi:pyrroline-5-carboxylate reductase